MVTSISCTWPRLSVICRLRVTWPQPSYWAVGSRSVASTMPVILAAHPGPSQRPDGAIEHGFQVPQVQLHNVIGQGIRADGPRGPRPLPVRGAPLADPVPHLVRIEPHQAHERLITEQ